MMILETTRLTIRRLTVQDAPFILELLNDPTYIRFISDRNVRTLEAARNHILQWPMVSYQRFGFGLFLVELTHGRVPVGICGLIKRDILHDVDIGYAFLPQFRGQGYAFEAASATLMYGREVVGLKRVVAATLPNNAGSVKLLQKLGLKFEQLMTWSDGSVVQLFGMTFLTDLTD